MLHSGLYTILQQQGMLCASYHMLAYRHKHSLEKLHPVYTCRNAAKTQMQPWIAAWPSSRQSCVVTLRQHPGSQMVCFLLSKAVLAQCDFEMVLLGY